MLYAPCWLAAFSLSLAIFAAEEPRIGLSPLAEKKAQLDANIASFKAHVDGSTDTRKSWDELNAEDRTRAMAAVAWSKEKSTYREKAIRALARISPSSDADGTALKALASVAVAEGDGSLRALARKALTAEDDKRAPKLLAKALEVNDPLVKNNAIEALRDIGGPRVFEVIVEHWKEIWGEGPRGYVFIGTQRSYISDYDISGSSYDPVVKSFLTGAVLDAKVVRVEADVYYLWIREVTGERKLPNDPAAWNRWIKKNEAQLTKQAEKNKADALAHFKDD
ncbi:MAG: HEAT repeat domain-containing protein [Planctomycetota bacterium]